MLHNARGPQCGTRAQATTDTNPTLPHSACRWVNVCSCLSVCFFEAALQQIYRNTNQVRWYQPKAVVAIKPKFASTLDTCHACVSPPLRDVLARATIITHVILRICSPIVLMTCCKQVLGCETCYAMCAIAQFPTALSADRGVKLSLKSPSRRRTERYFFVLHHSIL